jgi:peptide/nickel transport system substrate-binding protein
MRHDLPDADAKTTTSAGAPVVAPADTPDFQPCKDLPPMTALDRLSRGLLAAGLLVATSAVSAQALRVGLAEDPDVLDPTLARTFVGRIVFSALCDKLLDIDEKLTIVPQLAQSWQWSADAKALTMKLRPGVTFHDGEKFDAAAVKFNLERHKTLPGSNRRGELAPLASVDVVDPMTVRLNLSAPFSPLLAALADRAGMMVSPKAAQAALAANASFGAKPVCSGPFKFVERVAQDRIVFERYDGYWNKANIHFDKITYTPIVDATVRLANLKSGQFDFIERVASSDMEKLQADKKFKVSRITEIGYQGITINIGKSDRAKQNPLGRDARVREAFELSLDRQGLAQVVMDNEATVGNQWVAPNNPFYAKSLPVPKRNVERARALLKEAGVPNPSFTLVAATTSDAQRLALVVQAMSRDAGFDVKIQSTEFATSLNMADKGDYEAYILAWSGRADPDGNAFSFHACKQPLNYSGFCSEATDALLKEARTVGDVAARKKAYEQVAAQVLKERPIIYLYHRNWLWGYNAKLAGVRNVPDGLLRLTGLKMQ